MSPEQARGLAVDKRTDIWAFGCVLYEMVTGQRAFPGGTFTDTIAAVIEREPNWTALPTSTPPAIRRLLERCLAKDQKLRLRDVGDARIEIDEALLYRSAAEAEDRMRPVDRRWRAIAIAAAALIPAAVVAAVLLTRPNAPSFEQLTFDRARIGGARFVSGGTAVVYSEAKQGDALEIFRLDFADSPLSHKLSYPVGTDVLAARTGELALSVDRHFVLGERFAGTLATAPLAGGTPRAFEEDVEDADWTANGDKLAVVRSSGNALAQSSIEFPAGHVLYQTNGSVRSLRISHDGQRLAFVEDALAVGRGGHVSVVDLNGNITELTGEFASVRGLAWSQKGDEIWFAAGGARSRRALRAVTLDRRERIILESPTTLTLWDVAADGRVLLSSDEERRAVLAVRPGETHERDLSWFDDSGLVAISDDGNFVLCGDRAGVYLRATDGSLPKQILEEGAADDLSPDGRSVLATIRSGQALIVVPTGLGSRLTLPKPPSLDVYRGAKWFPDGQHILFTGTETDKKYSRSYIQDVNGGPPEPFTPEDTRGLAISPMGDKVAGTGGRPEKMSIWSIDGKSEYVKGSEPGERPVAWSADGRSLWVFQRGQMPAAIYKINLITGGRQLWKTLVPPDAAGVYSIVEFRVTPTGDAYAYGYTRLLSQLYLARGVK